MRILISAITYHPTIGGADDFIRSIAEGLANRGNEVLVVASDLEQHISGKKLADCQERELGGVRVRRCRSVNLKGHVYPVWPGLYREIRSYRPDVVHAFGLGYFSADGPCGVPLDAPVIVSPTGGRYRSGGLYSLLRRTALRLTERAKFWTALSRSEQYTLRRDHPNSPPVRIVSPSVDPGEWSEERPDPFPEIGPGKRILYAGRVTKDKGIEDLVAAAVGLDAQLLLVGPDYGYVPPTMPNVRLMGPLDRDRLLAAFQNCTAFVLPSRHEGFGIALLEAMAAGKPVVGYDNTAIPELVRDGINGRLVRTGDVAGLRDALLEILGDPLRAESMGARGRTRAFGEFSRAEMIGRVLSCYREALVASG